MTHPQLEVVFFDLGETLVTSGRAWLSGAQALLAALKSSGYRQGIISNTGELSRPKILELLPADFDLTIFEPALVIFSSEVHVAKPNPKIFINAVAAAGASADRCLFCSEDPVDTLVAQQTGMRALRVQKPPLDDLPSIETILNSFYSAMKAS